MILINLHKFKVAKQNNNKCIHKFITMLHLINIILSAPFHLYLFFFFLQFLYKVQKKVFLNNIIFFCYTQALIY